MSIFVPEAVAKAWVYAELVGASAVTTALGNSYILPGLAPPEVEARHIAHGFYGPSGGKLAVAMGRGVVQVCLYWRVTGWEPSYDDTPLEPVMEAVMTTLTGSDGHGRIARFAHRSTVYTMECRFAGPDIANPNAVPAGVWSPITHLYDLVVRPAA